MTVVPPTATDRMDAMTKHPLGSPGSLRSLATATAALTLGLGLLAGCGDGDTEPVASDP